MAFVLACSTSPSSHGDPCEATAKGQGVTITIRSASCDYDRGAPATFDYEVTTDANVEPIVVAESPGCGSCRRPSAAIASWVTWSIGGPSSAGVAQLYCLCDTGCCAPDPAGTYQPEVGTQRGSIAWSGRTWSGPSDTGQKEGDFFEGGRYDVSVSFGSVVTAKLPIVVRDD